MKSIAAFVLLCSVSACSGPFLYVDSLPNISGASTPYPTGYREAVARTLLRSGDTVLVSELAAKHPLEHSRSYGLARVHSGT